MKDVVEQLKKDPGSVKWGGGSRGSTEHIAAAMLAREVGVDPAKINYVAFRGGGEAIAAILGGNVTVGGSGYSEFAEYIKTGKMRAIAVTSETRLKGIDVPTMKEQGYNVVIGNWRGVYGAAGHHAAAAQGADRPDRQGDQDQGVGRGAGEERLDAGAADRRRLREVRRRRVRQPARRDAQVGNDLKASARPRARDRRRHAASLGVGARRSARCRSRRRPAIRASARTSCPGWSAAMLVVVRRAAGARGADRRLSRTGGAVGRGDAATGPASPGSRPAILAQRGADHDDRLHPQLRALLRARGARLQVGRGPARPERRAPGWSTPRSASRSPRRCTGCSRSCSAINLPGLTATGWL